MTDAKQVAVPAVLGLLALGVVGYNIAAWPRSTPPDPALAPSPAAVTTQPVASAATGIPATGAAPLAQPKSTSEPAEKDDAKLAGLLTGASLFLLLEESETGHAWNANVTSSPKIMTSDVSEKIMQSIKFGTILHGEGGGSAVVNGELVTVGQSFFVADTAVQVAEIGSSWIVLRIGGRDIRRDLPDIYDAGRGGVSGRRQP